MESLTVSELNDYIKSAITSEFGNKSIKVCGEISNIKGSGFHTYLTLKDEKSSISVAFWRKRLDNDKKHGDNVEIHGCLDYYTKSSNITFIGKSIKDLGIGTIYTKYEELKEKYDGLGYFNNRKHLPDKVKNVGIVTSYDGAALHDFLYVLKKNDFCGNVFIYDCIVQGSKCPNSFANGIKFFNSPFYVGKLVSDSDKSDDSESSDVDTSSEDDPFAYETDEDTIVNKSIPQGMDECTQVEVDMIVVTRGGGSFEDLIGFSHPKVIEGIYKSNKYVISAIGHEVDNMLSDYVANYRAPTPSIAGEVITSISSSPIKRINELEKDAMLIKQNILRDLYRYKEDINKIKEKVYDPRSELMEKLHNIESEATKHITSCLEMYKNKFTEVINTLNSHDTKMMLEDGFVVFSDNDGNIVNDIKVILSNKKIKLIHSSGTYDVTVKKCKN